MGGSLSEGLRTVFAVVLACLVIGFGFMIWQNLKSVDPTEEQYKQTQALREEKFRKYDGVEISGQELRNILKDSAYADYAIEVKKPGAAAAVSYNNAWDTTNQKYATAGGNVDNITNTSHAEYISTKAKFIGSLITTNDGDIMGLHFEKQ